MTNSRAKGCRGEVEFAHWLEKNLGIQARRGQQFSGNPEAPDVIHSLDGVHFEVKRVERFEIYKSMEQAKRDAGDAIPVVAHRRNRGEWLLVIPASRLVDLLYVRKYVPDSGTYSGVACQE